MKKRVISAVALLLLMSIMSTQVALAAEPRVAGAFLDLSFEGTTAICSVICSGNQANDDLVVNLTLYHGNTWIDSWSGSGKWLVSLEGNHKVVSGETYRLEVAYTINGIAKPTASTTATCP